MKIDLHVHSSFSGDSSTSPQDMIIEAKKKGLDGLAFTDHNMIGAYDRAREFAEARDFLLIPGVEISTDHGHVLLIGVNDLPASKKFEDVLKFAKDSNAATIAAHPFTRTRPGMEKDFVRRTDAVEIINTRTLARCNRKAEEYVRERSLVGTAGSDAHRKEELGQVWNEIEAKDWREVVKRIKQGQVTVGGENPSFSQVLGSRSRSWIRELKEVFR
ncbi:MAG: PHP domain-containing protein [Candidatus Aenigmatarchaeota archaeon]